jgi:electron transport complex protein RnfG
VTGQPINDARTTAPAWQAVASLAAFAGVAALVIGVADAFTRQRIAGNEARELLRVLHELVPPGSHDNDLAADRVLLPVDGPGEELRPVHRARRAGAPTAAILASTTTGYAGPIRLLVAIDPGGQVLAARAIEHQETPGIGDFIDPGRSPWMDKFSGRALGEPPVERWRLRSENGDFDAVAGATITSRAVINGVRHVLEYAADHREEIWAP